MQSSGTTSADSAASSSAASRPSPSSTSTTPSPLISRDSSPARVVSSPNAKPYAGGAGNRPSSSTLIPRPRRNTQNESSPTRTQNLPAIASTPVLLSTGAAASFPHLHAAAMPQKHSADNYSSKGDAQKRPISNRLRSPPPIQPSIQPVVSTHGPILSPASPSAHLDSDTTDAESSSQATSWHKSAHSFLSPSSSPLQLQLASDMETDVDSPNQRNTAVRTPTRLLLVLETVQEISLPSSPRLDTTAVLERVRFRLASEVSDLEAQQAAEDSVAHVRAMISAPIPTAVVATTAASSDSSSEMGGTSDTNRKRIQSGMSSPPPLSRQPSVMSTRQSNWGGTAKQDGQPQPANHMTVETEVVEVSVIQSPVQGTQTPAITSGVANGTVKSIKPSRSSETIRPKKDKERKRTRKQPAIHPGAAPSKADNFEAKIACAVDEATASDSEETFVYDSNHSDRQRRFHSRTPSNTSMASQTERGNLRSIYGVLEGGAGAGPVYGGGRKGSKFMNTFNISAVESLHFTAATPIDDDGKSTVRSTIGSTRGPGRLHHHFGRRGRGSTNGHPSLFDSESPFPGTDRPGQAANGHNSLRSPEPVRPPSHGGRAGGYSHGHGHGHGHGHDIGDNHTNDSGNGTSNTVKWSPAAVQLMSSRYDMDDTTTGGDDEQTPLLLSPHHARFSGRTGRPTRSGRRMLPTSPRRLEAQSDQPYLQQLHQQQNHYQQQQQQQHRPRKESYLNRFAACLVVTIMLFLVITGAISFMFATSQPLTDIELVTIDNVLASEPELMFDITLRAHNPNIVVVTIDQADLEIFAKSAHAGSDWDWSRHGDPGDPAYPGYPGDPGYPSDDYFVTPGPVPPPPLTPPGDDDSAPNMRLGTITEFDSPLSFEGSFFHHGSSRSKGEVRLPSPGNSSTGGNPRWAWIIESEFDLIVKGVVKYSLPLSAHVCSASVSGRVAVKPNAANDSPKLEPNATAAA